MADAKQNKTYPYAPYILGGGAMYVPKGYTYDMNAMRKKWNAIDYWSEPYYSEYWQAKNLLKNMSPAELKAAPRIIFTNNLNENKIGDELLRYLADQRYVFEANPKGKITGMKHLVGDAMNLKIQNIGGLNLPAQNAIIVSNKNNNKSYGLAKDLKNAVLLHEDGHRMDPVFRLNDKVAKSLTSEQLLDYYYNAFKMPRVDEAMLSTYGPSGYTSYLDRIREAWADSWARGMRDKQINADTDMAEFVDYNKKHLPPISKTDITANDIDPSVYKTKHGGNLFNAGGRTIGDYYRGLAKHKGYEVYQNPEGIIEIAPSEKLKSNLWDAMTKTVKISKKIIPENAALNFIGGVGDFASEAIPKAGAYIKGSLYPLPFMYAEGALNDLLSTSMKPSDAAKYNFGRDVVLNIASPMIATPQGAVDMFGAVKRYNDAMNAIPPGGDRVYKSQEEIDKENLIKQYQINKEISDKKRPNGMNLYDKLRGIDR